MKWKARRPTTTTRTAAANRRGIRTAAVIALVTVAGTLTHCRPDRRTKRMLTKNPASTLKARIFDLLIKPPLISMPTRRFNRHGFCLLRAEINRHRHQGRNTMNKACYYDFSEGSNMTPFSHSISETDGGSKPGDIATALTDDVLIDIDLLATHVAVIAHADLRSYLRDRAQHHHAGQNRSLRHRHPPHQQRRPPTPSTYPPTRIPLVKTIKCSPSGNGNCPVAWFSPHHSRNHTSDRSSPSFQDRQNRLPTSTGAVLGHLIGRSPQPDDCAGNLMFHDLTGPITMRSNAISGASA